MTTTTPVASVQTIVIDGIDSNTVTIGQAAISPFNLAGTTILVDKVFTVEKSACLTACGALGAQTSPLTVINGEVTQAGDPIVSSATGTVDASNSYTYTYGERTVQINGPGGSTSSIAFATLAKIGAADVVLNAGGLSVNGQSVLQVAPPNPDPGLSTSTFATASTLAPTPAITGTAVGGTPATTAAAAAQSSVSPNDPNGDAGISPGAAGGIGIGCLLAGALIGALAMFFLRRRERRRPQSQIGLVEMIPKEKDSYADAKLANGGVAVAVASSLPLATEDKHISRDFGTLCQRIRDHVDCYYDCTSVRTLANLPDLHILGPGNEIRPELMELLSDPATRSSALCFCIAWTIISRLDVSCDPRTSFLPASIAAILPQIGDASGPAIQTHTVQFCLWRSLTASLLHPSAPKASVPPVPTSNIAAALNVLEPFLAPFATASDTSVARTHNLEEILKRGARFGWLLFGQPGVWEFRWRGARAEVDHSLVVFPGLVQTVSDEAQPLERERTLVVAECARV